MEVPVVPHKAVAEVSKIEKLQESLVVVTLGCQSELILMGQKVAEALSLSLPLFLSLSLYQPNYLPTCLSIYLATYLSI